MKDATGGDTGAEAIAEVDVGIGLREEGRSITSIDRMMIGTISIAIADDGAIARCEGGKITDTENPMDEIAIALAALTDLIEGEMAKKTTGLDQEMDDPDEVEVPRNVGRVLQVIPEDD